MLRIAGDTPVQRIEQGWSAGRMWKIPTMWMNLSNLSKTKPMETTKSIATGFPTLDVGDFVGWEELEGRLFDPLF